MLQKKHINVAILDMYNGVSNQGMRCIKELLHAWSEDKKTTVHYDIFDVRQKAEIPDFTYDAYISTGGPGSPIDSEGSIWENAFFSWITKILLLNQQAKMGNKKQVLFICHSYQLACRYFNIASVCKRRSPSFGVFPVTIMPCSITDSIFNNLPNPFYAVDSRAYQVIEPNEEAIKSLGMQLLALEKERPHVPLERAIMGVRFTPEMVGLQFHPEADAIGMHQYLLTPEHKKNVIDNHGKEKWESMVTHLQDPDKILLTYHNILYNFLNRLLSL